MKNVIKLKLYDHLDPYEKTIAIKHFEISRIENPECDDANNIWFDYDGKHYQVKGDVKEFTERVVRRL